jgi:RNA polymerase-interacting CarD/CdnL/TRCF family regulator
MNKDEDELDEEDRARLHEALERAAKELDNGEGIDADEVLRRLHERTEPGHE